MTKKELRRDKYLRRTYGRSLRWYNRKLDEQDGRCEICNKHWTDFDAQKPLAVDHDHKLAGLYIYTLRIVNMFVAYVPQFKFKVFVSFKSPKVVRKKMRMWLKRKANRGLLCYPCNTALRKLGDKPKKFLAAAIYLHKYQAGMEWRNR